MQEIAKALKETRELYKISVYKLAKETGIFAQNIQRWEKGQAIPSIINCILLADYYQIPLDELVGRTLKKNW